MSFTLEPTSFEGVSIIHYDIYSDNRGILSELYHEESFQSLGIDTVFVQDNISTSKKGVLRGLHFQKTHPQAKLILPLTGRIYDVVVDMRKDSKTYGKYLGVFLEKTKGLSLPRGFAHGFLTLSDEATVFYKCDEFYHPNDESGIIWNDPNVAIDWKKLFDDYNIDAPVLSEKDKNLPTFIRVESF